MNAGIKANTIILFIFSIITFAGLLYILFQVNTDLARAINIYKADFETVHYLIVLAHLVVFLFHPYAIIFLFVHFRRYQKLKLFKSVLLVLSVISLFAIGVEKIMIDEIAREYRQGLGISELFILNFAYITNMAFSLLIFLFLLKTIKLESPGDAESIHIEEVIFIITQCMGIAAGFTGVLFTLHMINFVNPKILMDKFWVLFPFYILFLIPYALAALYWLSLKRKKHMRDWYDEKQIQDMFRSSFITLFLSIPGLMILLLFPVPHPAF